MKTSFTPPTAQNGVRGFWSILKVKKKYGLKDNSTFAEAIKKFTKESEELPHDPITKRGINAIASELAGVQEGERVKKDNSNVGNMFEGGGFVERLKEIAADKRLLQKVKPQMVLHMQSIKKNT